LNITTHSIMAVLLCRVFLPSVANKPFMLSVVMLNVILIIVVMLSVVMLSVIMLNVVMVIVLVPI